MSIGYTDLREELAPADQATHAVATIIAIIRCLPREHRVDAFTKVIADIFEGIKYEFD